MSTKCHPKNVHEMSPKRRSSRGQKCPRDVAKSVHEMSPLLSTRCHLLCPRNVCHPRAILSCGLYFFYPIFTLSAAYIADNLCTKNGNSLFKPKMHGLYTRAVTDQEWVIVARVRYSAGPECSATYKALRFRTGLVAVEPLLIR